MKPEIARHFQTVFDQHNEAIRALRASQGHMAAAVRAFGEAINAHDEAVAGALAANQAAIDLLHVLSNGGTEEA